VEWLWTGLLCLAAVDRRTRPLAVLLAAKAAANYAAAFSGAWAAVPVIDVAAGSLGVWLAMQMRDERGPILAALFVVVPVVHGWHWLLWDAGIWVGVQYHALMLGLFTAQAVILGGPGGGALVIGGVHWLAIRVRRPLAGVAAADRHARRAGPKH
jgi:hypothetical protein